MTGRRHHFLPRFLQRPFSFRQKGKHFYVYAHYRARDAYATNVMELGQELDFYGSPADTSLDDAITAGERQLSITVNRLNNDEPVTNQDMATLISAISIRTKSMRNALTNLMPLVLEAGRSRLLDDKRLRKDMRASLSDPQKRKKLIYEQIRKNSPQLNREQQAKLYAKMLPQWKSFVADQEEQFVAGAKRLIRFAIDKLLEEAKPIADGAFLQALSQGPESPKRAQRLVDDMLFNLWDAPPGQFFVLGDCGPVAWFTDGIPRLALGAIDNDVEMEQVFLPISPARCIVARSPTAAPVLDVPGLNRISAALSHEFVISHEKDDQHLDDLRQAIGSLTPLGTADELFRILNDEVED